MVFRKGTYNGDGKIPKGKSRIDVVEVETSLERMKIIKEKFKGIENIKLQISGSELIALARKDKLPKL